MDLRQLTLIVDFMNDMTFFVGLIGLLIGLRENVQGKSGRINEL